MCGIVGWLGNPDADLTRTMREALEHRGPDSRGDWWDQRRVVWLGHRRLAILDLSPHGEQPMISPSGRYALTYNGEVYNHRALRGELEASSFRFRGHSDTEVVLAAIEVWGLERALARFVGMFAFALYDDEEGCLSLVRDRLGIKPLYYAERAGELAFASELRPLRSLPWLDQTIDRDALTSYFRYLCVPAPATIYVGARKLPPGCVLRWDGREIRLSRYWSLQDVVREGLSNPYRGSREEAAEELESRLRDAIRLRMVADVPVGAFLSGGVDSSTVVALMQAESSRPVQTFSIGFDEPSHDESRHARAVARHLGTEHHEHVLTSKALIELVPRLAFLYDEPFADGSNAPTYLLSQLARGSVTVALSGDGGDEVFGGYPRYFWAERIEWLKRRLSASNARRLGRALARVPSAVWDGPVSTLSRRRWDGSEGLARRIRRFGAYLGCPPERVYERLLSAWPEPHEIVGNGRARFGPDPGHFAELGWPEQMMAVDTESILVDDFLTKVDRASMAVSLEVRVPLLDHRLVEWSWHLPRAYKIASGDRGKLLLRDVLYRYVPPGLIERPKMGLGMPAGRWLRDGLRPWAEDLLSESSIRASGILAAPPIRRAWREHLDGADRLAPLWTVLMFLEWHRQAH